MPETCSGASVQRGSSRSRWDRAGQGGAGQLELRLAHVKAISPRAVAELPATKPACLSPMSVHPWHLLPSSFPTCLPCPVRPFLAEAEGGSAGKVPQAPPFSQSAAQPRCQPAPLPAIAAAHPPSERTVARLGCTGSSLEAAGGTGRGRGRAGAGPRPGSQPCVLAAVWSGPRA